MPLRKNAIFVYSKRFKNRIKIFIGNSTNFLYCRLLVFVVDVYNVTEIGQFGFIHTRVRLVKQYGK